LFESEENIHELSDPEIYDDYDLFIELEKYYLERLNDDNEDGEFLQSATMKYLKNKQANQMTHDKKQKEVDRKASKNRKIRFNVHTKLLNFMPSCQ
jgi:protein AATF/BFR2